MKHNDYIPEDESKETETSEIEDESFSTDLQLENNKAKIRRKAKKSSRIY